MKDDRSEYLDPEKNPMIPTFHPEVDLDSVSLIDGHELAPMMILNPRPEAIAEKLNAAFPGDDVIEIAPDLRIQRTAAGTYKNLSGYGLADLSIEDLIKVSAFLAERGR